MRDMAAAYCSRAGRRQAWRWPAEARRRPASAWQHLREVDGKGRSMIAAGGGFRSGELIFSEQPMVVGRCCIDRCPGCVRAPIARAALAGGAHSSCCRWVAASREPLMAKAIEWHTYLSGQLAELTSEARTNHIRVVCLLAVTIQAAVDGELRVWLLSALRPPAEVVDPASPSERSTRAFARRFAQVMPLPPTAINGGDGGDGGELGAAAEAWRETLYRLLMRLQTNLFYVDKCGARPESSYAQVCGCLLVAACLLLC
jgi:hypothetical protein